MNIRNSVEQIFATMEKRCTPEEMDRIHRAFDLAYEAHLPQKRKSGEPYIIHPIAVATIAANELCLDADIVCACFLHDVVEDTPHTIEEIEQRFGHDVAHLVNVVTKSHKERYQNSKQIDNYQQIIRSMDYDVRALLVKLSDRLHNMRTLSSMKPEKQMKIAAETIYFYAPLAGRLGLYHVKSELENLSFKYRCPQQFEELEGMLVKDREDNAESLTRTLTVINEALAQRKMDAQASIRYRRPYSIYRDMIESGDFSFSSVDHKHYIRITYNVQNETRFNEKECAFYIYSILSGLFNEKPGTVRNYIDHPKSNGYQGMHITILDGDGRWQEVHIASARMRRNARLGCIISDDKEWLENFRKELTELASSNDGKMFMQGLRQDLYNEDVIAFTPKGQGIVLPKGATALDFAFELHTDIGRKAKYAKVNGKLCSIGTTLKMGDCVLIGTDEEMRPEKSLLKYAHSYKALRHLKEDLARIKQPQYNLCPKCSPIPGDEVIGIADADGVITVHKKDCPEAIEIASGLGDTAIVHVSFDPDDEIMYPVGIEIESVDRYHLLMDIMTSFEQLKLSVSYMHCVSIEHIVYTTIVFPVHSKSELKKVIATISLIDGVDNVKRSYKMPQLQADA